MNDKSKNKNISIQVLKGKVLEVKVYRGFAKLSDLARISKADIYDQINNPSGTQRDLNVKHAREAYEYVKNHDLAFYPEVFLCVRDPKVISFVSNNEFSDYGELQIDLNLIDKNKNKISVSRVDGNHRLHFADGTYEDYPPIDKIVSFCLAYELTLDDEIILFRDINDNQRRMNTSHLDNIEARLTPEEKLKRQEPALFIAKELGRDSTSSLFERVYEGGKKAPGHGIPLRSLNLGIRYMLAKPTKLTALRDVDAQYKVIKNYFSAVKKWKPESWTEPKKHLTLRGAGLWAICLIGADIIDRVLTKGVFDSESMYNILASGNNWDWSNKGDFQGYSGAGGSQKICDMVTAEFKDDSGLSVKSLLNQIKAEK